MGTYYNKQYKTMLTHRFIFVTLLLFQHVSHGALESVSILKSANIPSVTAHKHASRTAGTKRSLKLLKCKPYTRKTWSPTDTMYPTSAPYTLSPTDTMYPTNAPFTLSPTTTMYPFDTFPPTATMYPFNTYP